MSKKLFVHVGTEKTGTTSIQDFVADHKKQLKKKGLTFLDAGTESNHHYWLAKALGFRFAPQPVDEKKEERALAECRAFMARHPQEDLLLTSEHFDFNPNPENIEAFVDFFRDYEVNVVLYLRDQISYCQSLYAEHIKWGGVLEFSDFINRTIKQGRYSYLKKYDLWEGLVDRVVVVDYNAKRKRLISAFLGAVGLAGVDMKNSESVFHSNPTPSIEFLEVVRLLNSVIPKVQRRQFYLDLLDLIKKEYPAYLKRTSPRLPLKFKAFFEEEFFNNRILANLIGKDESGFLRRDDEENDVFHEVVGGGNYEPLLRELIFK